MTASKYKTSPRTKKLLANAIMELAETMPVSKIKITDICEKAELNRQSFYYHFRDKYDLVAWIFFCEFEADAGKFDKINGEEMIISLTCKLEKNRSFYRNAFLDDNQNNLPDYMLNLYINMELDALKKYYGTEELDDDLVYDTKSYSYGCILHTKEWLTGKDKMSAETFAKRMYRDMPEELKKAFAAMK